MRFASNLSSRRRNLTFLKNPFLREILHLQTLLRSNSLLRVDLKHRPHQLHGLLIQLSILLRRKIKTQSFVSLVDLVVIGTLEEVAAGEKDVEQSACRKDIAYDIDMLLLTHADDLGSDVAGRAAAVEEIRFFIADGRKSEIDEHGLPTLSRPQHNILQLNIPMHDAIPVHAGQGLEQPAHDLLALLLVYAALPIDALEEVASAQILSDHEEGGLGLHYADYFDDVGVVQSTEHLYFIHNAFPLLRFLRKAALGEHLSRKELSVPQSAHRADRSRAA